MRRETFRTPVLAASLLFQSRVIPAAVRSLGRSVTAHAMKWLDRRRDRLDAHVQD